MRKYESLSWVGLALIAVSASAQSTNTFPASGNAGIGTTSPQNALDIEGGGYLQVGRFLSMGPEGAGSVLFDPSGNYMRFAVGSTQVLWLSSSGNVGIGTTTPTTNLQVVGNFAVANSYNAMPAPILGSAITYSARLDDSAQSSTMWFGSLPYAGAWLQVGQLGSGAQVNQLTYLKPLIFQPAGGNVGIGTTTPAQPLEVNGNAQVDGALQVGSSGIIFPNDGGTQTTAWTGVLCGGDYAEAMNAAGGKAKYESGDVLVLATDDNRDVQKSSEPYSTTVAGIVATKPGVIGLRAAIARLSDNVPMTMVGVVPTKVIAENGPIHRGDLLVTASLPGYAMKGTDRSRMLGAVIGKAMGSLGSGTGVIEVLVTLQ